MRGKGVGEVLTLMSNDVDKILDWFWTFPLGVCSVLQYIGPSSVCVVWRLCVCVCTAIVI